MTLRMQTQIFVAILMAFVNAENNWVWDSGNQRAFNEVDVDRTRIQREREPTTKRPLLRNQQNEDIDRYVENEDQNDGSRDYYQSNGYNSHQLAGFSNYPNTGLAYPNLGNEVNGILVGPGGPTGLIGRSQIPYSLVNGGYPQGIGAGFNGNGQNIPGGYTNQNQLRNGRSQYPQGNNVFVSSPGNPSPNSQYPYNGRFAQAGQFGTVAQYPEQILAFQYPSSQSAGAQYAIKNPYVYPASQFVQPYNTYGASAYGTLFNEDTTKKFKAQRKNSALESRSNADGGLDDEVKILKKV